MMPEYARPTMTPEYKKYERSLRNRAKRLGFRIEKSRVRNTHWNNQGKYMLIDSYRNLILGDHYSGSLEQIAKYLDTRH